jgi:ubiquinone/menaquinone biosynthesis C-methylase UbiE
MKTSKLWKNVNEFNIYDPQYPSKNAQDFLKYHVEGTGKNILDVGCGNGITAFMFNNAGLEVSVIDSSESVIRRLQSKDTDNEIATEIGNFTNLPFESNQFDYIFSEGVLYYGDENSFISGVSEIYRCLNKNGVARIYTKTDRDYWTINGDAIGNDTFKAKNHQYENGMLIYCAPYNKIVKHMAKFIEVTIGIEEFNYMGSESMKSFWVITAMK